MKMVITKVMSINKDLRKEVLDLGHSIIKKLERWEGTDKESLEWASRQWHPTLVLLPGESQGWGSLVGCRLWGCTELDTTEATWQQAAGKVGAKCEAQESGILGAKWESVPIRCCDRSSKMGPEKWSLDNFLGSWINLLGFRNLLFWLFHTWWSL